MLRQRSMNHTHHSGCSVTLHPVFFILVFLLSFSSAQAEPFDGYIEQAHARNLAQAPYWNSLGHYFKGMITRESLIDDPTFFISLNGKADPQAELDMTIKSMFDDADQGDKHTLCRYPARVAWLKEELSIPVEQLPQPECTEYNDLIKKVAPSSAELVFPGPHINSPSSMFGHTLLNIYGEYQSKLLTYSVNYSAQTNETNGFTYAFKGLFGFYQGRYSILPYYTKVREYGDLESRDIWEYRLNLTPEETRRLVDHVWEMNDHYADYYFFSENCSFNLLYLFEVARPGVQLAEQGKTWVLPIDTIRQVEQAGLIAEATYRPSKARRMERLMSRISGPGEEYAFKLSHTPEQAGDLESAQLTDDPKDLFDLAIEDLDYRYLKQELEKEDYKKRYVALLSKRSKLGVSDEPVFVASPPEQGHRSSRLSLYTGIDDDDSFIDLSFRPGHHHLRDPANGYPSGAQIEYLHTLVRFYADKRVRLERFDIVNIFSVAPRNLFFPVTSWKIYTGLRRVTTKQDGRELTFEVNPGGGWSFGSRQLLWYLLGEARVGGAKKFLAEAGASTGLIYQSSGGRSQAQLRLAWFSDVAANFEQNYEVAAEENIALTNNLSLNLDVSGNRKWGQIERVARIGLSVYW
jgi:hypothetical protein